MINLRLSKESLAAIVLAFQKALIDQEDISQLLRDLRFRTAESTENDDEIFVMR